MNDEQNPTTPPSPDSQRENGLSRITMAMKNASVIARFGRLQPRTATVYCVPHQTADYRLRCYEIQASRSKRIPILLVPPLMISADVYDMASESSAVSYLTEQGFSVWLVDFGAPELQEGGLDRDFSDHILAVNDAIDFVSREKSAPVHLAGYSQGGIFCYLATAFRGSKDVASVIGFGSPVNIYKNFIPGIPDEAMTRVLETIGKLIPKSLTPSMVPAWASKNLFKLMSPTKEIKNWISFLSSLHDRQALLKSEEGRSFLGGEGFVAWPGPALQEFFGQMLLGNRLVSGGCVVEERTISLTEITCPILIVVGSNDEIARAGSVRGIADAVPNAEIYELSVEGGHMGIVVGSKAMSKTWPSVGAWLLWRENKGRRPGDVAPLGEAANAPKTSNAASTSLPLAVFNTLLGMSKGAFGTVGDVLGLASDSLQNLASNFNTHFSYLSRLDKLTDDSEISFARALSEQALKAPKGTYFLYDGRAHSYADANRRVDNIVRGLISIGVRTGDHVGILMHARPSSLATIMAANRLGAVAVLLRHVHSASQTATELKLGRVQFLIADPENAENAEKHYSGQVYILGGFGRSNRKLPLSVRDMEQIDPAKISLPDWYRPSPGRARDIAYILFSGKGEDTSVDLISNKRWALSALGTASATSLMKTDTAFCWTPLHDPTGLIVAVSASLVAGARVAVARKYDAGTFWKEARSYGAKVVFYAGNMLRELVDAPPNKLENGHSIRMFAGVGMPTPLAKRVQARFPTTKVMEVFVAKDTNAYLANISCKHPGPVVQPLPGGCDIKLVHWDHDKNQPYYDAEGYLCPVPQDTPGMLLTKENSSQLYRKNTIYNVLEKGDCWQITNDLFLFDENHEYHFIDKITSLIHVNDDWLPSLPIENAVWQLDCVSIAAAYQLDLSYKQKVHSVPAVAVELRNKTPLEGSELSAAVKRELDPKNYPRVVRIANKLPMTLGQQVKKQALREEGLPESALKKGMSLWFNPDAKSYEPLNKTSLPKLLRSLDDTKVVRSGRKKKSRGKAKTKAARATKSPPPKTTLKAQAPAPSKRAARVKKPTSLDPKIDGASRPLSPNVASEGLTVVPSSSAAPSTPAGTPPLSAPQPAPQYRAANQASQPVRDAGDGNRAVLPSHTVAADSDTPETRRAKN